MNAELVLYSRPGCHLCELALDQLVGLHAEGYRFELREVDIESDESLLRAMLERIPVLELNGEVISELALDQTSVRARLDTVVADDRSGGGGPRSARWADRRR
jgi:glutaredoxin